MFVFVLAGLREARRVSESLLLSLWMWQSTFNGHNLLHAPGLSRTKTRSTWKPNRVIRSSDLPPWSCKMRCAGTVVKVTTETFEDHSPPIVFLRSLL